MNGFRTLKSHPWLWLILAFVFPRTNELANTARAADTKSKKSGIQIVADADGFWFSEGDRKVFYYRKTPKSHEGTHTRAAYIHPLLGLDGEVLTQEFPRDHPHHHGVFWAWHQLWVGDLKAGDPWETKNFLAVVRKTEVVHADSESATFKVTVDWTSPLYTDAKGKQESIIEEQTTIRLYKSQKQSQWIDFKISLRALVPDVRIGGAENDRGYSGFTVRVKPPKDQIITDENGVLKKDNVGTSSRWMDVSGTFTEGKGQSGVSILSHSSLPEFPPKWLLRHYGMQNVVYPGRHPVSVSQEKPLVLRHRLLIHRGNLDQVDVPAHQKLYEDIP